MVGKTVSNKTGKRASFSDSMLQSRAIQNQDMRWDFMNTPMGNTN